MELLTIRECSLGAFAESLQEAILQGYRHSQDPTRYAWQDNQFNAILERSDAVVANPEESAQDETEEVSQEQPNKPSAGRPRRKL